jgi:hypothetical protein
MRLFDIRTLCTLCVLWPSSLLVAACASGGSEASPSAEAGADAAVDVSAPLPDAAPDSPVKLLFDAGDSGPCPAPIKLQCSPTNFNQVVDCNNNVIMTCSADQACDNGHCVPACQAVAKSQTSLGCEFYTHIPDTIWEESGVPGVGAGYDGACFAMMLVNSWAADLTVEVDLGGQPIPNVDGFADYTRIVKGSGSSVTYAPLDASGKIHPGDVAIVFLASGDPSAVIGDPFQTNIFPCPPGVVPAVVEPVFAGTAPEWNHGTQIRKAFHVKTSLPVSAADVYPFAGGSFVNQIPGASMLLPVASWTTNYVTVDPAQTFFHGSAWSFGAGGYDAWVSVVASAPDTHVTIVPPVDIPAFGNVAGARAGVPFTYTLQAGQALEIAQGPEFAGAPIASDQPIGVFGGHECLVLPLQDAPIPCDAAHAQIPPIANWASRYVEVPMLRAAGDAMMVRMVGAVNGTTLTYTPSAPTGAPSSLANGQVADFVFSSAFVVASQDTQHPFYASTIMTSCGASATGGGSMCGDPEFINAVPPDEYMNQYTAFADPSYANATLTLVQDKGGGYSDVTVDCLPGNKAIPTWSEIQGANVRYATVPLRQDGNAVGACDAGVHVVSGHSPFGLTVWGVGDHTSYAYTPAMGTKTLTTVTVGVNH